MTGTAENYSIYHGNHHSANIVNNGTSKPQQTRIPLISYIHSIMINFLQQRLGPERLQAEAAALAAGTTATSAAASAAAASGTDDSISSDPLLQLTHALMSSDSLFTHQQLYLWLNEQLHGLQVRTQTVNDNARTIIQHKGIAWLEPLRPADVHHTAQPEVYYDSTAAAAALCADGRISCLDHLKARYGVELQYPDLPCIAVKLSGTACKHKPLREQFVHYPLELCSVLITPDGTPKRDVAQKCDLQAINALCTTDNPDYTAAVPEWVAAALNARYSVVGTQGSTAAAVGPAVGTCCDTGLTADSRLQLLQGDSCSSPSVCSMSDMELLEPSSSSYSRSSSSSTLSAIDSYCSGIIVHQAVQAEAGKPSLAELLAGDKLGSPPGAFKGFSEIQAVVLPIRYSADTSADSSTPGSDSASFQSRDTTSEQCLGQPSDNTQACAVERTSRLEVDLASNNSSSSSGPGISLPTVQQQVPHLNPPSTAVDNSNDGNSNSSSSSNRDSSEGANDILLVPQSVSSSSGSGMIDEDSSDDSSSTSIADSSNHDNLQNQGINAAGEVDYQVPAMQAVDEDQQQQQLASFGEAGSAAAAAAVDDPLTHSPTVQYDGTALRVGQSTATISLTPQQQTPTALYDEVAAACAERLSPCHRTMPMVQGVADINAQPVTAAASGAQYSTSLPQPLTPTTTAAAAGETAQLPAAQPLFSSTQKDSTATSSLAAGSAAAAVNRIHSISMDPAAAGIMAATIVQQLQQSALPAVDQQQQQQPQQQNALPAVEQHHQQQQQQHIGSVISSHLVITMNAADFGVMIATTAKELVGWQPPQQQQQQQSVATVAGSSGVTPASTQQSPPVGHPPPTTTVCLHELVQATAAAAAVQDPRAADPANNCVGLGPLAVGRPGPHCRGSVAGAAAASSSCAAATAPASSSSAGQEATATGSSSSTRRRPAGSTCAGRRSLERGYRYLITKLTPCENFSGFWQNQQMKDVWRAVHSAIWEAQNKQHNANWQLQRLVKAGSFVNKTSLNGASDLDVVAKIICHNGASFDQCRHVFLQTVKDRLCRPLHQSTTGSSHDDNRDSSVTATDSNPSYKRGWVVMDCHSQYLVRLRHPALGPAFHLDILAAQHFGRKQQQKELVLGRLLQTAEQLNTAGAGASNQATPSSGGSCSRAVDHGSHGDAGCSAAASSLTVDGQQQHRDTLDRRNFICSSRERVTCLTELQADLITGLKKRLRKQFPLLQPEQASRVCEMCIDVVRIMKAWSKYSLPEIVKAAAAANDSRCSSIETAAAANTCQGPSGCIWEIFVVHVLTQRLRGSSAPGDTYRSRDSLQLLKDVLRAASTQLRSSAKKSEAIIVPVHYTREQAMLPAFQAAWGAEGDLYAPFLISPVDPSYNCTAHSAFRSWDVLAAEAGKLLQQIDSAENQGAGGWSWLCANSSLGLVATQFGIA